MAIRLLATYEFIDKDGNPAGMVRLPVVDYAEPDSDGRERPRVLLLSGDDPYLVDFHPDSDGPQGHAILLISQRDDRLGSHSGPVSTRDLPGAVRYRREDEAA